jgi:hypothetical protein
MAIEFPQRGRVRRGLLVAAMLSLVLGRMAESHAEDPPLKIRHVYVPASKPQLWPRGERVELPIEEYLELYHANAAKVSERRATFIEWQSLTATFDRARGVLTDGRWTAEVRGAADGSQGDVRRQLLSLEPFDSPLSELKWENGDAIWGTTAAGETMVLVDAQERRLEAKFSRQGRRLHLGWQFDLRLASATVSELTLRIPADFTLKCSSGAVRGPLSSGEGDWRLWRVHLGSLSRCELLLMESRPSLTSEPIVVYEQSASYIIREAEIEVQHEIQAEIFHTPQATLTLSVPEALSIYSVGFAGDTRLKWTELPRVSGRQRLIEVTLPEPQIGRLRSLQLLAGVGAKRAALAQLPGISLPNGWFTSGRWNVSIETPLVWRALQPTGLRLTGIDASAQNLRRLSFTQFQPEASLELDVSAPETLLTSHGLQRLTATESAWRLNCEWLWQANSGVAFSARCRIPSGWEVLDVQSLPETSPPLVRHWDVVKESPDHQLLVVDFARALESNAAYRVSMIARRLRETQSDRDSFELPTTLDCRHSDLTLIVQSPTGWKWDSFSADTVPGDVAVRQTGSPWTEFELWKSDVPHWTSSTLISRFYQIDAPLRPLATFVAETTPEARVAQPASNVVPRATNLEAGVSPPASVPTGPLTWISADLQSLIFPGGEGHDVHTLQLRSAQATSVGQLEFELPPPAELLSVRMNGVRTEPQRADERFRLPTVPQGGLRTLEIQYRVPSDREFLRNRQSFPLPRLNGPVLGFRWLFAMPPDARLAEEPPGLRLLKPLDPTPWSRRLFGPLGRDESSEWFNPLSGSAWQELWQPTDRQGHREKSDESLFAPPGWNVRQAVAATMPAEISWLSWSGGRVRALAWMGMLVSVSVGCVLRLRRIAPRVRIAACWLSVCVVGVILSAPVYAEVLGGCLIGTIIAVLIPRRVVMSHGARQSAAKRGAFDATVAFQQVVSSVILAMMIANTAHAQERSLTEINNSHAAAALDVLVPVDHPLDATQELVRPSEKLPLVFLSPQLLRQLRERRERRLEPGHLLGSARYELDWDGTQTTLRAEFVVHRLRPRKPTLLRFPFVSIPLAGADACLVDGKPRSVTVSQTLDAILLELPAVPSTSPEEAPETPATPATHRVTFRLLPAITSDEALQRVNFKVPPVLSSHVVVRSPPEASIDVPARRGEFQSNRAAGAWTAQIGRMNEITVELLKREAARPLSPLVVKPEISCLAELQPTLLRQRYRVRYAVSDGEINEVRWLLPRDVLLRDGDVLANDLLQWIVEPAVDGRQQLVVQFSRPQTGEFIVDVTGIQRPLGSAETPRWEAWDIAGTVSGEPSKILLGVSPPPGFQVALQSTAFDRVTLSNEATFAKSWGSAPLARQPQSILQVQAPATLEFSVSPLALQRKVRQELLLKIRRRSFQWVSHAEVTTGGAAAFQHELKLPADFRADDVSITEDEAERLVSWTQQGQKLSLFLRDATTGIQNIVMQGQDVIPDGSSLTIPISWFKNADVGEFSVRVTHDPSWQVEVLDDRQLPLAPTDTNSAVLEQPELFLGKFRVDGKSNAVQIRLTPHRPARRSERWTRVSQEGGTWLWRHVERLVDDGQITARIVWPNSWVTNGTVELSPTLKELTRRPVLDGIELTVQSLPEATGPREIVFESRPTISASSTTPRAIERLRSPHTLDVEQSEQHWLISAPLKDWLASSATSELTPVTESDSLPEKLLSAAERNALTWFQLSGTQVLEIAPPASPAPPPAPKLLWIDTTVWVADGAIREGLTWLLVQPQGLRELRLQRPDDVRWTAVFINDRPQPLRDEETATTLTLRELPDVPLWWLSVYWRVDAKQRDRIVVRRDTQLPQLIHPALTPERHDVTLLSTGDSQLSSIRGARRIADWEGRSARAEVLLATLKALPESAQPAAKHLLLLASLDLAEARRFLEQATGEELVDQPATSARSEQTSALPANAPHSWRQRIESAAAEATAMRTRIYSQVSATGELDSELWSSDLWRGIPDSWSAIADRELPPELSIIVVNRRWLIWVAAAFALAAIIPLARAWLRWQTGEWLAAHPYMAWAMLGTVWWICLAPSLIGFALLILAAIVAARQRRLPTTTAVT